MNGPLPGDRLSPGNAHVKILVSNVFFSWLAGNGLFPANAPLKKNWESGGEAPGKILMFYQTKCN